MALAQQMLENVFTSCQRAPNTVPLEVLTSYSNYRRERFALQRTLVILVLIVFLLLPLLFVAPQVTVSVRESDSGSPIYDVKVESGPIPVRRVVALLDGRNVPVYEVGDGQYVFQPSANGSLTLNVTLINRQITTVDLGVTAVDAEQPRLVSSAADEENLYLYIEDA